MSAVLVLVGVGTLFFFRAPSRTGVSAVSKEPAAVQENPDHELKELAMQLREKPGHLPVLMRMAQIEQEQGKLADAEAHLREAVTNEPNNADAHLELGSVLYEKGDRDKALKETDRRSL
jgi:protein O-GlcNAc transferase